MSTFSTFLEHLSLCSYSICKLHAAKSCQDREWCCTFLLLLMTDSIIQPDTFCFNVFCTSKLSGNCQMSSLTIMPWEDLFREFGPSLVCSYLSIYIICLFKCNWKIFKGDSSVKIGLIPSEKASTLKKRNLLPRGANSYLLEKKRIGVHENKHKITNVVIFFSKMAEHLSSLSIHIKKKG